MNALTYLQLACGRNFFYALKERLEYIKKHIKSAEEKSGDWQKSKTALFNACEQLGSCYWSLGYAWAAFAMLDLGNTFHNKRQENAGEESSEEIMADERYKLIATEFYEYAVKFFFKTYYLYSQKTSKEINSVICEEKDLANVFGFDNLAAANDFVKTCSTNYISPTNYSKLREASENDVTSVLKSGGIITRKLSSG
jgi:hypothetical protein